jgi:hypothetical protein
MQKTLDILEKNVQWIVLGIAALFLLWIAYGYVLTPPATTKINNHLVDPSDAALETQKAAKNLDRQIRETRSPSFPTPDLVTAWRDHMMEPYATQLAANWSGSMPQTEAGFIPGHEPTTGLPHVAELAEPPAVQLQQPVAGLSSVIVQPPQGVQGNPNAPAVPVVQPQPKDTDWITISGVIPAAALKDALLAPFHNAVVDPAMGAIYNTSLLEVVLQRQQSDGVDANGQPTFDPKGKIDTIPALVSYQPILQQIPPDSTLMPERYQYLTWAQQNQALLANPMFYQVTAGDPWPTPQMPVPAPGDNGAAPAPQPAGGAPATGTPTPAPTAPGPTTPTPTPTTPAPAPHATGLKVSGKAYYAPLDGARPPGSGYPGGYPGRGYPNGGRPFNPEFGGGFNPNQMQMGNGQMPQGAIDPFNLTTDMLIWATDETAQPGQTYRYRLVYKLKNPVFGITNLAPPPMVNQFVIASQPSDWSPPVVAPPVTKFWVASVNGSRTALDVFRYNNGVWTPTKNMQVNPGDQVPGTNLTLVDVRTAEPRKEKYVLLTSDTGDMLRRDANADISDPDHQAMLTPNPNGPNGGPPPPDTVPPNSRPGGRPPINGRPPMPGHAAAR